MSVVRWRVGPAILSVLLYVVTVHVYDDDDSCGLALAAHVHCWPG